MPDDLQWSENAFYRNLYLEEFKKHESIMSDEWVGHYNKRRKSYLGRIPSQDFWEEAYNLFLEFATPEELENDILTRETLLKISTTLGL